MRDGYRYMKSKLFLLVGFVILFSTLIASVSFADTYYVRIDGNDSNIGKANTPEGAWQTIQKAAESLKPIDTVEIQTGTYNESIIISNSGTKDHPIIYSANGEVIIYAQKAYAFKLDKVDYIHLDGFIFCNVAGDGILIKGKTNTHNSITNTTHYEDVGPIEKNHTKKITPDTKSETSSSTSLNIENEARAPHDPIQEARGTESIVANSSLDTSVSTQTENTIIAQNPTGTISTSTADTQDSNQDSNNSNNNEKDNKDTNSNNSNKNNKPLKYLPNEVLVKFKPGTFKNKINTLNVRVGVETLKVIPKINIHRLKSTKGMSAKELMELYNKDPDVEYVEPNYIVSIDANPNDADYSLLWGLNNTGQTGGLADADIDAPEAWDYLFDSWPEVVVAVIDTGVDYNHPDLAANMWTNPGEIPGDGIDNDGNGYIDDYRGWDFYNDDNDPYDDHYHGTHCAGTIAAVGYNGIGVIGANYKAKIMPLKFLGSSGSGSTSDAIEAILYAAANGAKVMSNSWGGGGYSTALEDAINTAYANGNGAVFVASAGNTYADNDLTPHYPSSYEVPNVIAVAATDHNDDKASLSCYGFTSVDLGAPGVGIYSTEPNNGYKYLSGTSMAAPHVSGIASLIIAAYPYLNVDEVKNLILNSTDAIASLENITLTGGRLNARSALNVGDDQIKVYVLAPKPPYIFYRENALLKVIVSAGTSNVTGAEVRTTFSSGQPDIYLYDDGAHDDGAMNDGVYANYWVPQTIGSCDVTFSAEYANKVINYNIIDRVEYGNDNAEPYNWIDATVGTALTLSDDDYEEIPIGFDFQFYGLTYPSVKVSSNGYLTFGTDGTDFSNDPIPSTTQPNNFIAPFWDDLNPSNGGEVYYLLTGTIPNRVLTIEWYQVPHYSDIGAATFEVTLYESNNEIVFQYQDVSFEDASYDGGKSATVGVEGPRGLYGEYYSYNAAGIYNYMTIRFAVRGKGSISGRVLLEARSDHSDLITFELRNPGETINITTYQVNTTSDGSYILDTIRPGTYELTAKSSNFLKDKQTNIIVNADQQTFNINFSLLGGDANDDNYISWQDYGIIRSAYGSSEGDGNWNKEVDFNGDGYISWQDYGIFRVNYGLQGDN